MFCINKPVITPTAPLIRLATVVEYEEYLRFKNPEFKPDLPVDSNTQANVTRPDDFNIGGGIMIKCELDDIL
jgi:hypothetical protein